VLRFAAAQPVRADRRFGLLLQGDARISAFWVIGIVINVALTVAVLWYVLRSMRASDKKSPNESLASSCSSKDARPRT
jgi:hypothetical protein